MDITLKKVKLVESLSEETACFSADVYVDGKLVAPVSNRGQGGPNEVRPAEGLTYSDVRHLDNLDTECTIFEMVEEINLVKKNQGRAFVLKKDGEIYTGKLKFSIAKHKKSKDYERLLNNELSKFKKLGYTVLNTNL